MPEDSPGYPKLFQSGFRHAFFLINGVLLLLMVPMDTLVNISRFSTYRDPFNICFDVSVMVFSMVAVSAGLALPAGAAIALLEKMAGCKGHLAATRAIEFVVSWFLASSWLKVADEWSDRTFGRTVFPNEDWPNFIGLVIAVALVLALVKRGGTEKRDFLAPVKKVTLGLIVAASCVILVKLALPGPKEIVSGKGYTAKEHPVNVILITFDSLNSEDLSLYGNKVNSSPNMDEFAATSYVFDRAYSVTNWTVPTTTSILTGLLPSTHDNLTYYNTVRYDLANRHMGAFFHAYGYHSHYITNNDFAEPLWKGLGGGFDTANFDISISARLRSLRNNILTRYDLVSWFHWMRQRIIPRFTRFYSFSFRQLLPDQRNDDHQTVSREISRPALRKAADYVEKATGPFFLWVHAFPPHHPYLPPEGYLKTVLAEDTLITDDDQYKYIRNYKPQDIAMVRKVRLRYQEYIKWADSELKILMNAIKRSGRYDDSIIIVSADHGESFSHGFAGHGTPHIYNSVIHIPLIIHLPNQTKGARIKNNVSQLDYLPTIADLAGLPQPGWGEGISLKKFMESPGTEDNRTIFSIHIDKNGAPLPKTEWLVAGIAGDYKLIVETGRGLMELYNIKTDPAETENIFEKMPEKAVEIFGAIDRQFALPR